MIFIAHGKLEENGKWSIHSVEEHLLEVAKLCHQFASSFQAEDWAYLAGLWHDLGKYSNDFQQRICKGIGHPIAPQFHSILGEPVKDHSTAGALLVWQKLEEAKAQFEDKRFRPLFHLLAHAIAGHHAGLPNWHQDNTASDLRNRLKLKKSLLDKVRANWAALPSQIWDAPLPRNVRPLAGRDPALLIRMIFSALIDADRLDTERFYDPVKTSSRACDVTLNDLREVFEAYLHKEIYPRRTEQPINEIRYQILQNCLRKAAAPPGIFSLTVPTGGGKTLASMAFALNHAVQHQKRRIIYVIPYTSIIEQNADVFRRAFAALGKEVILEHHSNFDFEPAPDEPGDEDELDSQKMPTLKLATENWDMPIIVTTAVQFFESLFASHPGRCRKLHNIANSVVVLDEAQMLPCDFLKPIRDYIHELSAQYGVTFVLSTATQPVLNKALHQSFMPLHISEIVDAPETLYQQLNTRVQIHIPKNVEVRRSWDQLAEEIAQLQQSVLCIVNRKQHAKSLYHEVLKRSELPVFHLSTHMCAAHRLDTLEEIRTCLEQKRPIIVVSTQLVEAGVDLDFPVVYRALTGVDAIAQAAGRCNREGKLPEPGKVVVFVPPEKSPPGHLLQMEDVSRSLIQFYGSKLDILGLDNIQQYFERFYFQHAKKLDTSGIVEHLKAYNFKTAAKAFKLIDKDTTPILVPYKKQGQAYINELEKMQAPDFQFLRKIQRYSVSLYEQDLKKARAEKLIEKHTTMPLYYVPAVEEANMLYDKRLGLILDGQYTAKLGAKDVFIC